MLPDSAVHSLVTGTATPCKIEAFLLSLSCVIMYSWCYPSKSEGSGRRNPGFWSYITLSAALPQESTRLQVKDTGDLWKIWEDKQISASAQLSKKEEAILQVPYSPAHPEFLKQEAWGQGRPHHTMDAHVLKPRKSLLWGVGHVMHLPSPSASQEDLFPSALLHSYSAHSQRSLTHPCLFIRKSLQV